MSPIEVYDFFVSGTARAIEALRSDEQVVCFNCGRPIKYVFLTSKGPMGGDCLATMTGDNSTRKVFRSINATLNKKLPINRNYTFEMRPWWGGSGKFALSVRYAGGKDTLVGVYEVSKIHVVTYAIEHWMQNAHDKNFVTSYRIDSSVKI